MAVLPQPLTQPLGSLLVDQCCGPCDVEAYGGVMGSLEAPGGGVEACGGLGNVVNKSRPLDVCLPEPQAGYWFDRLVTGDCASGLMGAAFLEMLRLGGLFLSKRGVYILHRSLFPLS